jgi:hypothetical protein
MPNFDGNGPLRRGRVTGRGRGVCTKNNRVCQDTSCDEMPETRNNRKQPEPGK